MLILFGTSAALWSCRPKRRSPDLLSNLPDDVLIQILIRLPDSRSAIQCNAVCKRWNNLVAKNPQFVAAFIRHRHHCGDMGGCGCGISRKLGLILQKCPMGSDIGRRTYLLSPEKLDAVRFKKLPFFDFAPDGTGKILASFEDLLLVSNSKTKDHFIFNTITGWWVTLPPAAHCPKTTPRIYGLISKLSGANVIYRAVLLDNDPNEIQVSVFSSETQNWTSFAIDYQAEPISRPESRNYSVVACGGRLYFNCPYARGSILVLDPFAKASQKGWRFVALPEMSANTTLIPFYSWFQITLGVCRDRVKVCKLERGRPEPRNSSRYMLILKTMELKEDGSSWSFQHRVEFFPGESLYSSNVKFHPTDPDVLYFSVENFIYRCNFREKKMVFVAELPSLFPGALSCMSWLVEPSWPTPPPTLSRFVGRQKFLNFKATIIHNLKSAFEELLFNFFELADYF